MINLTEHWLKKLSDAEVVEQCNAVGKWLEKMRMTDIEKYKAKLILKEALSRPALEEDHMVFSAALKVIERYF